MYVKKLIHVDGRFHWTISYCYNDGVRALQVILSYLQTSFSVWVYMQLKRSHSDSLLDCVISMYIPCVN